MELGYIGVPAPEVLEDDPWFGPAPLTERALALREARKQAETDEQILPPHLETEFGPRESARIHQMMYEIATKNVATTLALDPLPTPGGSENFQEEWQSGAGPHFNH